MILVSVFQFYPCVGQPHNLTWFSVNLSLTSCDLDSFLLGPLPEPFFSAYLPALGKVYELGFSASRLLDKAQNGVNQVHYKSSFLLGSHGFPVPQKCFVYRSPVLLLLDPFPLSSL